MLHNADPKGEPDGTSSALDESAWADDELYRPASSGPGLRTGGAGGAETQGHPTTAPSLPQTAARSHSAGRNAASGLVADEGLGRSSGLYEYVRPLLRWWWLILISVVIGAVSGYLGARSTPRQYQARTTIMVGQALLNPNPNSSDFSTGQLLAQTYADLVRRGPVLKGTLSTLGLDWDWLVLQGMVTSRVVPGTQLIEISVLDTDAQRVAVLTNEIANQLILQSPSNTDPENDAQRRFIQSEIDQLQANIQKSQDEIKALDEQIANSNSAKAIQDARDRQTALQMQITTWQSTYAQLLINLQKGTPNYLSIVEPAQVPLAPVGPRTRDGVLLGFAMGLVLSGGAAFLLESLDDTLKSDDETNQLISAPILAHIGEMSVGGAAGIYVADHSFSTVAEAFRSLRTNLDFAAVDRPLKTLLITSSGPGDGKTLVASNLAATLAKGGKKVILLDADLRKPSVHEGFHLSNARGLSDIFVGSLRVDSAIHTWDDENLGVITGGSPPPNPAELISSSRMEDILTSLQERADIIVIDSAPFLVADSWVLASKVDAVLLIVRPNYTHRRAVRDMMEEINRSGARIVGVAMNRIRRAPQEYLTGSSLQAYYGQVHSGGSDILSTERVNVKRAQSSLELLNTISQTVAADRSLREVWKSILQVLIKRMDASGGSILLLDERGRIIDGAISYRGRVHTAAERRLSDTAVRGLAGWVIEHRVGAVVPNTLDDPRWLRRPWEERNGASRSAISVPLTVLNRVVGVLTLTHAPGGQFTNNDLALLTAVSGMISVIGVPSSEKVPSEPQSGAPRPDGLNPIADGLKNSQVESSTEASAAASSPTGR